MARGWTWSRPTGERPERRGKSRSRLAWHARGTVATPEMASSTKEAEQLRASGRAAGAFQDPQVGWIGRLARERLRVAAKRPRVQPFEGPDDARRAEGERLIREAARRAAIAGGLAATGANAGGIITLVTEGIGGAIALPAAFASVGLETVYMVRLDIDLTCDLAVLYGVHFEPDDVGEIVSLLQIAIGPTAESPEAARSYLARFLAEPDKHVLTQFANSVTRTSAFGLVPVLGVPLSANLNNTETRRLGESIHRYMQQRRAVRETLSRVLADPALDKALLLEGAWLLAAADGRLTNDEIALLTALVRAIPLGQRPSADSLHYVAEGAWVFRMAFVADEERRRVLRALLAVAALRGPTEGPQRAFFERVGAALDEPIDLHRVDEDRRDVETGIVPPAWRFENEP